MGGTVRRVPPRRGAFDAWAGLRAGLRTRVSALLWTGFRSGLSIVLRAMLGAAASMVRSYLLPPLRPYRSAWGGSALCGRWFGTTAKRCGIALRGKSSGLFRGA